ncbi:MAG: ATP-binding protein [Spirulinaceae cyanobacterium SM2_1_0]|nr:ATP-binding protein [Spirulinaceae cyanobacterium SM2_1_0]
MAEVYGDYLEDLSGSLEFLSVSFQPSVIALQQRWRNGALASFLVTYLPSLAITLDINLEEQLDDLSAAVNYIANELLENALRFGQAVVQEPIGLALYLYRDRLVLLASNTLSTGARKRLQAFIQALLARDPEVLYAQQLARDARADTAAQLGYLTMLNDYQAELGWKFEPAREPELERVTVMVQLTVNRELAKGSD